MKILVTGARGFVGKRLIHSLLEEGHEVYALLRIEGTKVFKEDKPNLYSIWGDLQNPKTIESIPHDIEAAYYLVHSMSEIVSDLASKEVEIAQNFIQGLKQTKVKQIIYLGGIISDDSALSPHLKSRLLVENVLKESKIPVTILRASIIIGSGSASFEIIRDLTEKLPFMLAPKWIHTKCQPIAIEDVLFYLVAVLDNSKCFNKTFDIGGPQVLSFEDLLLEYAAFRNLKRYIVSVPVLTPRLSSLWLVFITSVRFSICYYLVESMKTDSICRMSIHNTIAHNCLTYHQALEIAFQNISKKQVLSTWMDSWDIHGTSPSIMQFIEVPNEGCLKDEQKVVVTSREKSLEKIWSLGGSRGYYTLPWAWKLRGLIDKLFGGVGLNRGRRHPTELEVGDSIDFWRVLCADKEKGDLILFAGMKLPGEAWLEFHLQETEGKTFLIQTATFRPKGLWGRLYWYALLPFHYIIFRKMAQTIANDS